MWAWTDALFFLGMFLLMIGSVWMAVREFSLRRQRTIPAPTTFAESAAFAEQMPMGGPVGFSFAGYLLMSAHAWVGQYPPSWGWRDGLLATAQAGTIALAVFMLLARPRPERRMSATTRFKVAGVWIAALVLLHFVWFVVGVAQRG